MFTKEPPGELPQLGTSPYEQIDQLIITKEGVEKLLSQLKPNKAPGPDGIPPWFLKLGAKQLASPLQDMFQKYLGVHISNTLSWNIHVQESIKKAQRVQNVIRRNLWSCNSEVKATAYLSLVRPLLEYAASAWDPSTKQNINSLERVQRQAARFCTGNYQRDAGTVTKLLDDLEWDTLQNRRNQQKLCMLYKMKNGLVDIPLHNYVQPNTRDTRGNNQKFIQVSHKARAFKDSFFVSTVKHWNSLSSAAVNSATLAEFKGHISNIHQ